MEKAKENWGVPSVADIITEYRLEHPRPVLTKRDFVRRFREGEFGNASPTWDTPDDFLRWGSCFLPKGSSERVKTRFHLRSRIAGGATHYNLFWSQCVARWVEQEQPRDWYVSEMAPNCYLLNAEVMQSERGLDLYYSTVNKPMREALAEKSLSVSGILSVLTLRRFLCPNSLEWLYVLLDRYKGHVIELSTFARQWGTLPGYNTCFWEVRLGY